MINTSGRRLYDPSTHVRIGRRFARQVAVMIAICAVVSGGLIGGLHYEELPFLASWLNYCEGVRYLSGCEYPAAIDWIAGVLGALVFGLALAPLVLVAPRRVKPAVFCRGCDHMGWIEDITPTGGRCPRCGSFRFDRVWSGLDPVYFGGDILFLPMRSIEMDVAGPDLLQRARRSGRKAT